MTPDNIGDVLTALRISKGWSQSELAKRSGVSRNYISMIERNDTQSSVTVGIIQKLFEPFGVAIKIDIVPNEPKKGRTP